EATPLFEQCEIERAVEKVYSGAVVSVAANSNYGRAFRQFVEHHLEAVTSRTTVIILGDGRSNYFPPEAWALARVKARARHVLWLHPEQPSSWMFGDSAMKDYLPHISRAEVVTNLASLKRVIDELVL
ncbi:MAG: VWA domain-containing protein, partial [Deltaproteobacteria bacterium]|nr:VWA domain-containing protein [Deltaproteobacteria bacterium]